MSSTSGAAFSEAYTLTVEFFLGWHCIVANFVSAIDRCTGIEGAKAEEKKFLKKSDTHLKVFKTKLAKELGIRWPDGKWDDSQNFDWPETVKKFMNPVGAHINAWEDDISLAIAAGTNDDNEIEVLDTFKGAIAQLPTDLDEMYNDVRLDMMSIFDEILGNVGSENDHA